MPNELRIDDRIVALEAKDLSLGSGELCDVVVRGAQRHHADLRLLAGRWMLWGRDDHEVFVNGAPTRKATLKPGDRFRLTAGGPEIAFVDSSTPRPPTAPTAAPTFGRFDDLTSPAPTRPAETGPVATSPAPAHAAYRAPAGDWTATPASAPTLPASPLPVATPSVNGVNPAILWSAGAITAGAALGIALWFKTANPTAAEAPVAVAAATSTGSSVDSSAASSADSPDRSADVAPVEVASSRSVPIEAETPEDRPLASAPAGGAANAPGVRSGGSEYGPSAATLEARAEMRRKLEELEARLRPAKQLLDEASAFPQGEVISSVDSRFASRRMKESLASSRAKLAQIKSMPEPTGLGVENGNALNFLLAILGPRASRAVAMRPSLSAAGSDFLVRECPSLVPRYSVADVSKIHLRAKQPGTRNEIYFYFNEATKAPVVKLPTLTRLAEWRDEFDALHAAAEKFVQDLGEGRASIGDAERLFDRIEALQVEVLLARETAAKAGRQVAKWQELLRVEAMIERYKQTLAIVLEDVEGLNTGARSLSERLGESNIEELLATMYERGLRFAPAQTGETKKVYGRLFISARDYLVDLETLGDTVNQMADEIAATEDRTEELFGYVTGTRLTESESAEVLNNRAKADAETAKLFQPVVKWLFGGNDEEEN